MGDRNEKAKYQRPADRGDERERKRIQRQSERAQRSAVDILAIDGDLFLKCIEVICSREGAIRLGLSRDGGAYAIGIYGDGDPYTEYVGAGEDINEYFAKLAEYFRELGDAS